MAEKFNSRNLKWPSKQMLPQKGGELIAVESQQEGNGRKKILGHQIYGNLQSWLSQKISQI